MRTWTVEEANKALPRVRELVEQIRSARATLRSAGGGQAPSSNGQSGSNGSSGADTREPIRRALEELMNDGIVLRDPERGLIDFPAVSPSGRRYWLCWVVGEPSVAWWHWPEDGFEGRRPLSDRPA
jgi:hypothetical protein